MKVRYILAGSSPVVVFDSKVKLLTKQKIHTDDWGTAFDKLSRHFSGNKPALAKLARIVAANPVPKAETKPARVQDPKKSDDNNRPLKD